MQFYHLCTKGYKPLVVAMVTKVMVSSFSVMDGRMIPHISKQLSNNTLQSLEQLVCRDCGKVVPLEDSFSDCGITGEKFPVKELKIASEPTRVIFHPSSAARLDELIGSVRKKDEDLLPFILKTFKKE